MTVEGNVPMRATARKVVSDPALKQAVVLFVVLRVIISLWAALVLAVTNAPTAPDEVLRPYQGVEPIAGGPAELFLGVWQRFDSLWYLKIATRGYSPDDGSTVYFPLYPLLIRLLGKVLLDNYLLAALAISSLAFIGVLYYLFKLSEMEFDRPTARRSVIYLAVFPTAFFFLAAYTESLFLLLTLLAFHSANKRRWWLAATFGFLASLTRLQGVVLVVPLLYMYIGDRGPSLSRLGADVLGLIAIPAGALLFLTYQHLFIGSTSLLTTYEAHLHAQFVWPWDNIIATVQMICSPQGSFINALNLIVACLFLAMTALSFGRLPRAYSIYLVIAVFVLLLRRTTLQPLVSMSRYVLVLFPVFMMWGRWGRNPYFQRLVVYPSVALLFYLSGQFAMWGWVA
jgi:hypothetical protein